MKLGAIATHNVIFVRPDDSFDRAITLMEEHGFHHLPVIEDGIVVGMLSDRDLLLAVGWKLEYQRRIDGTRRDVAGPRNVGQVMSHPVVALSPEDDLHTAARLMIDRSISALPILAGGKLTGIVTKIGLLQVLCESSPPLVSPKVLSSLVSAHMRASVLTVDPKDPLHTASRIMHDKHVRHLPVTTMGMLVGIISDRDVRRACGREIIEDEQAEREGRLYASAARVMDVMSNRVFTSEPTETIQEAARRMLAHHVGALPVCTGEELVGIITHTDILRLIARSPL